MVLNGLNQHWDLDDLVSGRVLDWTCFARKMVEDTKNDHMEKRKERFISVVGGLHFLKNVN